MRKSWLPILGALLLVLGTAAATAIALPNSLRITDEPGLVQPMDPVRTVGGPPEAPVPGTTDVPVSPGQPSSESPAGPPPAPVPVPPAGSIDIDDDDDHDDDDDDDDDDDVDVNVDIDVDDDDD
ncbi:MAG TPA: hypothetical protein VLO00_10500 [Cryobacterium sp.]|nr:hypothetical protein [Cryobacterium sp.]